MATATEIRNKAAKKLRILPSNQTVHSEDTATLDAAYTEVYAQLDALGLATWDSDEDIPDEFVQPVVDLVAYARLNEFAVPDNLYQRIVVDAIGDGNAFVGAEARIRRMQASNVYKQPTADYF